MNFPRSCAANVVCLISFPRKNKSLKLPRVVPLKMCVFSALVGKLSANGWLLLIESFHLHQRIPLTRTAFSITDCPPQSNSSQSRNVSVRWRNLGKYIFLGNLFNLSAPESNQKPLLRRQHVRQSAAVAAARSHRSQDRLSSAGAAASQRRCNGQRPGE